MPNPPAGFVALFNGKDITGWKGLVGNPRTRPTMAPDVLAKAQADADVGPQGRQQLRRLAGHVEEAKIQPVIDRFYGVCLGVAAALVDEGVASPEDTDRGAKIGLRWSTGPFEIMNEIGIERTYALVLAITKKYLAVVGC